MARTNSYTKEKAKRFCDCIASGMTINKVCSQFDDMPTPQTIGKWLSRYEEFFVMYMKSKAIAAELKADEMIDIADNADIHNATSVHKARLQIDTRKWLAQKLLPKVYGDNATNVFLSGNTKVQIDNSILTAITSDIRQKYSNDNDNVVIDIESEVKPLKSLEESPPLKEIEGDISKKCARE